MAFQTRPVCFGFIPNPFTSYQVTSNRVLKIRTWPGQEKEVPCEGMSAGHSYPGNFFTRWLRSGIDRGEVTLEGSPGKLRFERVCRASEFVRALRGEHPDVQPPPEGRAWDEDLILQSFELLVPPFPSVLLDVLRERRRGGAEFLSWNIAVGDRIRSGEVVAHYNLDWGGIDLRAVHKPILDRVLNAHITSPISGVVRQISTSVDSDPLFVVQPLLNLESDQWRRDKERDLTGEQYSAALAGNGHEPHTVHYAGCEAVWMFLDKDPGFVGDPNHLINQAFEGSRHGARVLR